MTTLEKIGWMAVTIGLLIGVTKVIIEPIYVKAKDQGKELEDIKFDTVYEIDIDSNRYLEAIERAV